MSDLRELVLAQNKQLELMSKQIHQLTLLVMKDKVDTTWIDEETAAKMLGYQDPRSLRKLIKKGVVDVEYRNTNGRNYQYSRKGILKYKEKTAVLN